MIKGYVYVVQGPKNCGKTFTIKKAFKTLDTKYPNSIKRIYAPLKKKHIQKAFEPDHPHDIKIEMQNIKGSLLGIESHGDTSERLLRSLNLFSKNGCYIIFCAETDKISGTVAKWIKSQEKMEVEYE